MSTSKCIICMDSWGETHYAGSEIKGRVECHFSTQTTLQSIKVQLNCREEYNEFRIDSGIIYKHINNILMVENELFRSGTGSLPQGRYVYPFSLTVPADIPPSYTGMLGSITYRIKAIVVRPMRFDYEDSMIITIMSPVDFNRRSRDLQKATAYSDEQGIHGCCPIAGTIHTEVKLPKLAFVLGEVVPFEVHIENKSNVNVELLKIRLVKIVTHTMSVGSGEHTETITKFREYNGVAAFGERTYKLELPVPYDVVVPNFEHSRFFAVRYSLVVTAKTAKWYITNPTKEIPGIQLGHIPVSYDQKINVKNGKAHLPGGFKVLHAYVLAPTPFSYIHQPPRDSLPLGYSTSTDEQRPPSISSASSDLSLEP